MSVTDCAKLHIEIFKFTKKESFELSKKLLKDKTAVKHPFLVGKHKPRGEK